MSFRHILLENHSLQFSSVMSQRNVVILWASVKIVLKPAIGETVTAIALMFCFRTKYCWLSKKKTRKSHSRNFDIVDFINRNFFRCWKPSTTQNLLVVLWKDRYRRRGGTLHFLLRQSIQHRPICLETLTLLGINENAVKIRAAAYELYNSPDITVVSPLVAFYISFGHCEQKSVTLNAKTKIHRNVLIERSNDFFYPTGNIHQLPKLKIFFYLYLSLILPFISWRIALQI